MIEATGAIEIYSFNVSRARAVGRMTKLKRDAATRHLISLNPSSLVYPSCDSSQQDVQSVEIPEYIKTLERGYISTLIHTDKNNGRDEK